ncbi:HAD-IA family hydrolase [Halopseudomonas salegens]|uniref:Phosphoglycolate phosphatase n=1 Tax=Halopseudomonas salegens TaxID=1434072 RepID=A0A1H2EYD8_9GAMM|nr:HAD-IA family hydrolase [Halopseudomonas salegens]SDU00114.1 phosphoglycolate phosphatase [Halopseudomonas salegens]
MTELQTLIFDWDGTLANSVEKIVLSMQRAADDVGLDPLSAQAVREIIGLGLPEAIAVLYPNVEDRQLAERLGTAYGQHYLTLEEVPSPLFDGVRDALDIFRDAGFRLAVATGKKRRGLARVLEKHGLSGFFDATRCADETASKPNPLMLAQILYQLDTPAERAIMLGDSVFDLQMAHNAGVRPVAVSYGAMTREQLLACEPEHCLDTFSDFHHWVMREQTQGVGV